MSEEWRRFRDTPYEVSNAGRIRRGERFVRLGVGSSGYALFGCYVGGRRSNVYAHRAVAEAFLGPCPEGFEVNHRDGSKLNNELSNLEYVTKSENQRHANRLGLSSPPTERARGERHWTRKHPDRVARGDRNGAKLHPDRILRGSGCPSSKLTEEIVLLIRSRAKNGESCSAIARDIGVTPQTIWFVVRRQTWKHVA